MESYLIEAIEHRVMLAVTASFSGGVLTVTGDSLDNTIVVNQSGVGSLLVNGGAVAITGGIPTVGNTTRIDIFGLAGNDILSLDETNGALPPAILRGGTENDALTGGSGADQLFGEAGDDVLLGKGGIDSLFGGTENDTLTGGSGDDQVFGEAGNDRTIWNPSDDTDLNEGGSETDTVEVNGGNGAEQFTVTANGTRVRFDRISPAPFSLDIGTSESLVLNANGGDDSFSATGNLAALIQIAVDGGPGLDTLLGSNGADILIGGDDNDFIDGQQGNDTAFLGSGNDVFQWDPGDGSDVIEGQAGTDTLQFNGSNIGENIDISANGNRVRFFRDVASITLDLNGMEALNYHALGGADTATVHDLTGTDATQVNVDLEGVFNSGAGDGAADTLVFQGTGGNDTAAVAESGGAIVLAASTTQISLMHYELANDRFIYNGLTGTDTLTVNGSSSGDAFSIAPTGTDVRIDRTNLTPYFVQLTGTENLVVNGNLGNDTISGSNGLAALVGLTIDGGDGADLLNGGDGADIIIGGIGSDTVTPGRGNDVAFLGADDDVLVWNPGDANDVVEGQAGADTLQFNGANIGEDIDISANGNRVRFFRNVAAVTMDLSGVETLAYKALGGADNVTVNDLSGTDATQVNLNLDSSLGTGTGDSAVDSIVLVGSAAPDIIGISGSGNTISISGLPAGVALLSAEAGLDLLTILPGDAGDVVTLNDLPSSARVAQVTVDLGSGGLADLGADSVVANANSASNSISITDTAAGTQVTGLGPQLVVFRADPTLDTLRINTLAGADVINVSQSGIIGAVRLVVVDSGTETDTITVTETASDGTVTVAPSTGNDTVNVNSDALGFASVLFQATQRLGTLNVQSGGVATLTAGGAKVLTASSLSIGSGGRMNLTDNDMILDYSPGSSPIATVQSLLLSGSNNGLWNGSGIITSSGNAGILGIGYGEASDVAPGGTFSGQPVDATAVVLKFTYYGDADLNGQVDISDLGRLATNWQQSSRRWTAGDFNHDSSVDISDLGTLATNWQAGVGNPLAPAARLGQPFLQASSLPPAAPISRTLSERNRLNEQDRIIA